MLHLAYDTAAGEQTVDSGRTTPPRPAVTAGNADEREFFRWWAATTVATVLVWGTALIGVVNLLSFLT
jgi:hypothetical protein